MLDESLLPEAIEMARRGCTPGMIRQMLKSHSLEGEAATRVVDRAFKTTARRTRTKGLMQLILGGAIVAGAIVGLILIYRTEQRGPEKYAIIAGMFGLIIGGRGLISLFSGI